MDVGLGERCVLGTCGSPCVPFSDAVLWAVVRRDRIGASPGALSRPGAISIALLSRVDLYAFEGYLTCLRSDMYRRILDNTPMSKKTCLKYTQSTHFAVYRLWSFTERRWK